MGRERRFFVREIRNESVELHGDEARHLLDVLRLGPGDDVALFDGEGNAVEAAVSTTTKDAVTLRIGAPLPSNESSLDLTIAVAVPKSDKMSLIVQKLTELGVHTIQPLVTDHGELDRESVEKRIERWRRVALEAAKQSARSRLPAIFEPKSFAEAAVNGATLLTPDGGRFEPSERATLLIGPEGGWSNEERALAEKRALATFGLGPRILRTETAAIVAATLAQWCCGDLRG